MSETARKPSKPWRVDGPADRGNGQTYRSQSAAYEAVRELAGFGHDSTVWHWEDGRWRTYDKVSAADMTAAFDTQAVTATGTTEEGS
jgi:hypothetical protein